MLTRRMGKPLRGRFTVRLAAGSVYLRAFFFSNYKGRNEDDGMQQKQQHIQDRTNRITIGAALILFIALSVQLFIKIISF